MPMIDVYAAAGTFRDKNRLAQDLARGDALAQVFDFELRAAEMDELDELDRSGGTRSALERKRW
jgi:hypothetical protein